MKALLSYPGEQYDKEEYPVVVVRAGASGKRRGLIVDELIGQQDIVIKPLGKLLSKVRGVAGATILGDGKVALILDVAGVGNCDQLIYLKEWLGIERWGTMNWKV